MRRRISRAEATEALLWAAHDLRTYLDRVPFGGVALAHYLSLWGHLAATTPSGADLADACRVPSSLYPLPRPATLRALADFLRALADDLEV